MNLGIAVAHLRRESRATLSAECALALGAFFSGYKSTDGSASNVLDQLTVEFSGPSAASGCTRACLTSEDPHTAFYRVLDAMDSILSRMGTPEPSPGPYASMNFAQTVLEAIRSKRPGIAMAEPTVIWLNDYFRGFLFGLRAVNLEMAERQEAQLAAFDASVRDHYGGFIAPWYVLIRVHEGLCEHGLSGFLRLWDRFQATAARQ
jgi:hypothetical protein